MFSEQDRADALLRQGQLSLYASATCGTAIYVCAIDRNATQLRARGTLSWISYVTLAISLVVYAVIQSAEVIAEKSEQRIELNDGLIILVTSLCAIVSSIVAFFAVSFDDARTPVDVNEIATAQQNELTAKFRETD